MRPNNLSSYLTKLGSIITALADLINTFTLASYVSIFFLPPKNRRTLKTEIADIQKKKRYIHNR
jgi:hypothetical protein